MVGDSHSKCSGLISRSGAQSPWSRCWRDRFPWAKDKQLPLSEALSGAWWVTLVIPALAKWRQGFKVILSYSGSEIAPPTCTSPGVTAGKGQVTETGSRVEPGPSVFLHHFPESPPQASKLQTLSQKARSLRSAFDSQCISNYSKEK